ncbi:MAG: SAM-dependent methyltransferase [Actinomycetes bacterium]
MSTYAALLLPSVNRVYTDAALHLVQAELEVFSVRLLGGRITGISTETIAGVAYITFDGVELSDRDLSLLGNVSAIYALYQRESDRLRPIELRSLDRLDSDLLTIMKYPGKTNEQFTRLLLNVTLASSRFGADMLDRRFSVLDPLCGRGTTLNQALMCGFDAYGIDADARDVDAYATFLQRWLKDKRLKHRSEYGPVRRDRKVVARRFEATFAVTKEDFKDGDVQRVDVVNTDTTRALEFMRPGSVDLVVTDAPYGVQHGSRTGGATLTRSPLELIAEAAPVWAQLLRSGGALGISWNIRVASRRDAVAAVSAAGLDVLEGGPYELFEHRVDQSIQRDVLVAVKN